MSLSAAKTMRGIGFSWACLLLLLSAGCTSLKRPAPVEQDYGGYSAADLALTSAAIQHYQPLQSRQLFVVPSPQLEPAQAAQNVLVPHQNGLSAYALADLEFQWRYPTPIHFYTVFEEDVWVHDRQGQMALLDSNRGDLRWQQPLDEVRVLWAALDHAALILATTANEIRAFSPLDGSAIWRYAIPFSDALGLNAFALDERYVYYSLPGYAITALDRTTGEEKQRIAHDAMEMTQALTPQYPQKLLSIKEEGLLLLVSSTGLVAYHNESGDPKWRVRHEHICCVTAVEGGRVLVQDDQGVLTLYSLDDGSQIWRNERFLYHYSSYATLMDDVLLITDATGGMHWLSLDDGSILYGQRVGGRDAAAVKTWVFTSNELPLCALTADGKLWSLSAKP